MFDKIEPFFYIDDEMKEYIYNIDNKLGVIEINDKQKRDYMVKKSKVRSIHSSLSIEDNSLSLFDVENISENKQILGKRDEIQEVKNAIEVYKNIKRFKYKEEKDFLKAHQVMMKYLGEDEGKYRNHGEGVKKEEVLIYIAPESILVPSLMNSLFDYINKSELNLIILSSIFHYYFVSIHPFSDGNGRMARLWVTLMLINYNNNFEFIPIEEEIYLNQEEYYSSITECHINHNVNAFIKFILKMINNSLDKVIKNSNFSLSDTQNKILELITNNSGITQNEIADILGVNVRTIKRNFKILIENCIIERIGSDKAGHWQILK